MKEDEIRDLLIAQGVNKDHAARKARIMAKQTEKPAEEVKGDDRPQKGKAKKDGQAQ